MGMSRALITGIGGFAGQHLAAALAQQGTAFAGYTLSSEGNAEFDHVSAYGDINDVDRMTEVLAKDPPDVVFHLAGVAATGAAWDDRRRVFEVNVLGTSSCLAAVAAAAPGARVVLVSSGLVYGHVDAGLLPVDESHPRSPRSPYAASKTCAEIVATEFCQSHDLDLVTVRPFNFAGPGQGLGFVAADFACQVAQIEAGVTPPTIKVGNLEAERDFTDVRDFVQGLVAAAKRGQSGTTYNLCNARPVAIRSVLDSLVAAATVAVAVESDPKRMRPSDVPRFIGDNTRAATDLGWRPRIPFEQTLADTLNWWRERVAQNQVVDG